MSGWDVLLRGVSERDWQAQVELWARQGGWQLYHTWNSRHSTAGFPDLVLSRSLARGQAEVLFVELKRDLGTLTPEQRGWLERLEWAGVEVAVWRPRDHERVRARLLNERR